MRMKTSPEQLEVSSVNVARLLSELEGCSMLCKYMGFLDDSATFDEIKARYYKLYFKLKKEERVAGEVET